MIRELSIENFMSIRKKQVLSFEATKDNTSRELLTIEVKSTVRLNRMLILYGANASGKSNILYAYETIWRMLVLPCTHKLQAIPFHPFALDKDKNTRLSVSFFICFPQTCAEFLKIVIFVHISLYKIGELLYNIMAKVIYMEIGESVWR